MLLLERLLAVPRRAGRPVRTLALSARLAAGGSWRRPVGCATPPPSHGGCATRSCPDWSELPGAVERLSLELAELGEPGGRQQLLMRPAHEVRRERAAEAARQLRAAMGEGHLLRVVEVAPWSRLPEGRSCWSPTSSQESG